MTVYEVVGVERVSGTSKKTGKPFAFTRLFLTFDGGNGVSGKRVMEVAPFDEVLNRSHYEPAVGDLIELGYRVGFDGRAVLDSISSV